MAHDDPTARFDPAELRRVLEVQDGVVARRQLLGPAIGAREHDVARLVRRRELVAVHRGVLVDHTGVLTPGQRAWAAALAHWPAALSHRWALPELPTAGPVHVAVERARKVRPTPGVVVHRTQDLDARVAWHLSPPRVRLEHAVLDVAAGRRDDVAAVFTLFADVCQSRRTTPDRISAVLATRRVPGRALMDALLRDLADGACSVLERAYLHDVERAHDLPRAHRQAPARAGRRATARDVEYEGFGLVVELDGRAFHDTAAARDRDATRDLHTQVGDDARTVRLTHGMVLRDPCGTAARLAVLLQRGGWSGDPTRCVRCPPSTG